MKTGLAWIALLLATAAPAQDTMGPTPAVATLDADAAQALERMGAHLRSLKSFQVRADGTLERVFGDGQKLQFQQHTTYTVQQPDRMMVDIQTDGTHRRVYYDGAKMTVSAVKLGKYTSFPVTGSLSEVLGAAYDRFGIDFPLQDLFRWGSPTATAAAPSSGFLVGASAIDGKKANHYAFRQPGVDFQLWIADGPEPLPLRMVITNTEDKAQPQYVARFTWNVQPQISATSFTFQPGPNDTAIDFGAMKAAAAK